jgi:plastocyanin
MRTWFGRLAVGVVALAFLVSGAGVARADTIFITVESNDFNPSEVTINAGDTICWMWLNGVHTTTSVDGLWDSGIHQSGFMFDYTFTDPGDYVYFCQLHLQCCNMAGIIHVNAVIPPCCPPPCCPPPCCPPPCCPPPCCPPAVLSNVVLSAMFITLVE